MCFGVVGLSTKWVLRQRDQHCCVYWASHVSAGQISTNRHWKKENVPTHRTIGIMLIGDLCQNVELFLFCTTCAVTLAGKERNHRSANCCIAMRFSNKRAYTPSVSDAENLSSVSVCKCNNIICTRSSSRRERKKKQWRCRSWRSWCFCACVAASAALPAEISAALQPLS